MAKYRWLPFFKFRIPFTRNYIAIHKQGDGFSQTVYEIRYRKNVKVADDCTFCYYDPADCAEDAREECWEAEVWKCFKEHHHQYAREIQVAYYNWVNKEKKA